MRSSGITVERRYQPDPAREVAAILALLRVGGSAVAPNGVVPSRQEGEGEAAIPPNGMAAKAEVSE